LTEWFAELDTWTMEVAQFCLDFDRGLDLEGALPRPLPARSSAIGRAPSSVTI